MRKVLYLCLVTFLIVGVVTGLAFAGKEENQFLILLNQSELSYLRGNKKEAKGYLGQAQRLLESLISEQAQEGKISEEKIGKEVEEWRIIKEWEGESGKTTEPFRIKSKMWRIRWESKQDMFSVVVYKPGEEFPVATPVSMASAGKDVSYVYKSGTFYLKVTAIGEWSIKVEEQK